MPKSRLVLSGGRGLAQRKTVATGLPARRPQPSKLARTQLLKRLQLPTSGSVFATLSPAAPSIQNRAALVFYAAGGVDCGSGCAWWREGEVPDPADEKMAIWWKAEAAVKRYLVDAVVNPGLPVLWGSTKTKPCPFVVHGPNVTQTFQVAGGGGHVAFVAETPTSGWYGFELSAPEPWRFTFWYCELTRL